MNKKTLSKITAILSLTTIITSASAQLSYASSTYTSCDYYTRLLEEQKICTDRLKSFFENAKAKGELQKELSITKANGETLLMSFAKHGIIHSGCIELILEYAKEANILPSILIAKDKNGKNALNYSMDSKASFETILKYAKKAGKINDLLTSTDNKGKTVLMHAAAYKDNNPIIDLILSYAEKNGISETVLNANHKPNNKPPYDTIISTSGEINALTYAIKRNNLKNVKKLISHGCKGVDCAVIGHYRNGTSIRYPVLKYLAKNKNFKMVKVLVENNKLINIVYGKNKNQDKEDLLKLIKNNNEEILFDLLNKMSKPLHMFHMLPQ